MIAILLADGFEEIEALTPLDILRRAGLDVKTVAIGSKIAIGSHGISVICDVSASEVNLSELTMVVLPGGMPGSLNLDASEHTAKMIDAVLENGGRLAAICAAPLVLGRRGLLDGKSAVCYPGFEDELKGATIAETPVVTDGNITTAKGMGVATEFSLELVRVILGEKKAQEISDAIMREGKVFSYDVTKPSSVLDSLDLFDGIMTKSSYSSTTSAEDITGDQLISALAELEIDARVTEIKKGPRVTQYKIKTAKFAQAKKIQKLYDDLMIIFMVEGIRISAPASDGIVTVEIPNATPELVRYEDVSGCDELTESACPTLAVIGSDTCGAPVCADITKMPHLIVSGATGMGKSVCVNAMLASIIERATPDEVKLIMIDTKMVEFCAYNGAPHLLTPIITDVPRAIAALKWVTEEMNRRYDIIAEAMKTNISTYNECAEAEKKMPRIIVVIDELSDLMLTEKRKTEALITEIAQKARAAGIHLIIGTQRPSAQVLTPAIRANIPSRISCKLTTAADSKTVLGHAGAEKLLNKGDALFLPLWASEPMRIQCAFISDSELEAKVKETKAKYGSVKYDEIAYEEITKAAN